MPTNVITFVARSNPAAGNEPRHRAGNNVISLSSWIGRAIPRRTPTGVFFTSRVLELPGEIA